ncbi:glycosyltransferase [candidate division WOR-3 bacterium]|nr:glycosyltransferase [candidate division WOR-3 bacterium]
MRVLVLTNMYPTCGHPFYGIFVKEQVESLRKEGINVDVFFINGHDNRFNYFLAITRLFRKLRYNHYDIVHSHHTYCIYPLWIAKSILDFKMPLISTLHEGEILKSRNFIPNDIDFVSKLVYSKRIKKWALQKIDFLITVNEDLVKGLNFNVRATVIPPGVNPELFRPMNKLECRRRLNLPKDKNILFFPADIKSPGRRTEKGFDILQDALSIIKRNDIFLLTGGNIPHQDVPIYMNAADVVIQTSNFEASPMVIKEAMACNIPIVSTDVGDTKWVLGDTKGCFICKRDPKDVAIKIKMTLDYGKRTNGRKRIERLCLGLEQIAKRIIEVYKGVLENL